jgi:hypothetical protein
LIAVSTAQPSTSGEAISASPIPQPDALIQVAGWALADMGVLEPGAALLEPIALVLNSLDARPSGRERSEA